jgi:hypothetical protein
MRTALRLLLVVGALLSGSARGEAQFIQVTGIQGVDFGSMVPGISKVVSRTDALSAARFDIKGAGSGRTVEVQFSLPAALTGPGGASLPLSYTAGDAGYSAQQSIGSQTGFELDAYDVGWRWGIGTADAEDWSYPGKQSGRR